MEEKQMKLTLTFLAGLLIGWVTVPLISAARSDVSTYKEGMNVMIDLLTKIERNTRK